MQVPEAGRRISPAQEIKGEEASYVLHSGCSAACVMLTGLVQREVEGDK